MTSINTNVAAMTALASLNMTSAALQATQRQISTGFRVNSASDNAAYWSIATTMKSDNSSLSTVKDALGLGAATVDVTYTAMNSSIGLVQKIKNDLVTALQPGVDRSKVQADISQLQSQLKSISDSSSFSGDNWLSVNSASPGYNGTKSIISSFQRSATGLTIQTISYDGNAGKLFDSSNQSGLLDKTSTTTNGNVAYSVASLNISTLTDSANDTADLKQMLNTVDSSLSSMTQSAANLGALQTRIDSQTSFIQSLMDAVTRGVGTMVDADMSAESTKLQALQVQQQLGTQALGIANQSSQSILSLFK